MRKVLLCLLAFFAASAQAQFKINDDDAKYATELLKPGTAVPDFKLRDRIGKWQTISKLAKGRYTVLDFWASWCPTAERTFPTSSASMGNSPPWVFSS